MEFELEHCAKFLREKENTTRSQKLIVLVKKEIEQLE